MAITKLRKFRNLYHELGILEERIMFGYPTERDRRRNAVRHGAYKKFPKKLLAREATRNAKRNARRKKFLRRLKWSLTDFRSNSSATKNRRASPPFCFAFLCLV